MDFNVSLNIREPYIANEEKKKLRLPAETLSSSAQK